MPKSATQKRKDNPRSGYWKNKADALWGEYVHLSNRCAMAGTPGHRCAGNLEAHHLISRAIVSLRHKPVNGILLCSLGHKYCTRLSPHMAPIGFSNWLEAHWPIKHAWAKSKQWATGKPDYRAACDELTAAIQAWKEAEHETTVPY